MSDYLSGFRNLVASITQRQFAYEMRRRLNTHHPEQDQKLERKLFNEIQLKEFAALKAVYVLHRDKIKSHPELTDQDRDSIESVDKCVDLDLEKEFGL